MLHGFKAEARADPVLLVQDFSIGNLLFQIEMGSWCFPFTQGSWTNRPPTGHFGCWQIPNTG